MGEAGSFNGVGLIIRKRHVTARRGQRPKQQNPSRIQAQWVAIWSAEPVPFGHLRTH